MTTTGSSGAEHDLGRIARALGDVTVGIHGRGARRGGEGAGVIWASDGLIVTNAHCVRQRDLTIRTTDGRAFDADVIAHHPRLDLALLTANGLHGGAPALGDVETLRPGELVLAYGHPLGVSGALALGVLHAVTRDRRAGTPRYICADIRLAPGNSGGPLADAAGRVIGINAMIVGGLGVAIPTSIVQRFVERVRPALAA